jgi:hypothetical protein
MIDTYPDSYAAIFMHVFNDFANPWGEDRWSVFYQTQAFPVNMFDGVISSDPTGGFETDYELHYGTRQAVPTDVVINLSGVELSSDTWEFTAEVCIEVGGTGKDMRIYLVQALDHYPDQPSYYRNTLMQGASTEDVELDPGDCANVVRSFSFGPLSMMQQEDIKIFAWAQDPLFIWPAEVHQAATVQWPFEAALFADGFESGDTSAWTTGVTSN